MDGIVYGIGMLFFIIFIICVILWLKEKITGSNHQKKQETADTKPTNTKPVNTKPTNTKSVNKRPTSTKPNNTKSSSTKPVSKAPAYSRKMPLDEEEISRILDEINKDFGIWSGPGYYHRDIVIVFENDHVRFSAQNAARTDFKCGWNIYYSKPLNEDGVWNDFTSQFRKEMGARTLAMLQRNYPEAARNLYLDGSYIILPTNG